jgi:hypothetical protein
MEELAEDYGKRFEPAKLLKDHATENKPFHPDD